MTAGADVYETVRLRAGVSAVREGLGIRLVSLPEQQPISADEEGVVRELAAGDRRLDRVDDAAGPLVARLRRDGWLTVTVHGPAGPAFTIEPHHRPPALEPTDVPDGLRLSRFTVIRPTHSGTLRITSPRAWAAIVLHTPTAVARLADLDGGTPAAGLPPGLDARLRSYLAWTGLAVVGDEDADFQVRQWSAIDLAFHHTSRGLVAGGYGATGWGQEHTAPLPARPYPAGPAVVLPRPDLDQLQVDDPSLTTVLESRRSVRDHDVNDWISYEQVAEFLFRSARTTGYGESSDVERLFRPYPSGGGLHELEIYLITQHVVGLAPGTYHYDGHDHTLELVKPMDGAARTLARAARSLAPGRGPAQVLVVITARFGRIMWQYEGLAYALILKNVGALVQTMHLVATAMDLAGCAIGGQPAAGAHAFRQLTGVDPLAEDVVGEFLLGTPVPAPQPGGAR